MNMEKQIYQSPQSVVIDLRIEGAIASASPISNPSYKGMGEEEDW